MSGLELACLGAAGAAYLDARFNIVDDIISLRHFIASNIGWALTERYGDVSAYSVLEKWAQKTPNKVFLAYLDPVTESSAEKPGTLDDYFVLREYSYAETAVLAQTYATYLKEVHGIAAGDVVALDFTNKPEYVFVWFALWCLGATPAMINYNLEGEGLTHCIKICHAKLVIVDAEVADNAAAAAGNPGGSSSNPLGLGSKAVYASREHFAHVFRSFKQTKYVKHSFKGSDPSCYIFTSGTTGLPKAANMSWKKAMWGSRLYASVSSFRASQTLFSPMPLYHSTAAVLGLFASLHTGSTYAIGHKFSARTFWTQAKICKATAVQYVGETCRYLVNAPPGVDDRRHSVRRAYGNGMRPDIWREFKERFGIDTVCEFYGATEFPSAIQNNQSGLFGMGACGHYGTLVTALSKKIRFQIAKVDQETQEIWRDPVTGFAKPTDVNEPGEFVFKINKQNVSADFQGYAGNKAASDEKVVFDLFRKGDAYVRTGDLLKIDEDNFVYFVDRLGDTFRWKSENVSTNEVEEAFSGFPNIEMAVCVGVRVPQHEGRAGFAVVQLKDARAEPNMRALAQHLLKRLPRYAVPVFVKVVDEISITGNNKVQKKAFREQQIPAPPNEKLYWLVGDRYELLKPQAWARVEQGQHKL